MLTAWLTVLVSSGAKKLRSCTAFTKNRDLHAVCSTGWLGIAMLSDICDPKVG